MSEDMQVDVHAQQRPELRLAVMQMDNHLHDYDLHSLLFLCQGLVMASKLKRVTITHELVSCLQKANLVSEDSYVLLADLLQYISRVDVLERISYDEAEVIHHRRQHGSRIDPFYVLLFHIAEELKDEEVKKARYAYGGVPLSQKVSSGLDLFALMIQHKAIGPQDVSRLIAVFQELERGDIVHMLNSYIATGGQSVLEYVEDVYRRKSQAVCDGSNRTTQSAFTVLPQQSYGYNNSPAYPSTLGRDRQEAVPFPSTVSEHTSMQNHWSSVPQAATSHGPPSLPPEGNSLPPTAGSAGCPQGFNQNADVLAVPNDFDERIISWQLLDILSKKIPAQYWPNFISRLGLHVDTQRWDANKPDFTYNMTVLKRWLQLPEVRAMDSVRARVVLVQAIHYAGPTLLAQEIAELLNVNIAAALQESVSSESSAHDTNQTSSSGPAEHIPEDGEPSNQAASNGGAVEGQAARQGAHLSLEPSNSPIPYYRMDRTPRGLCVIINNRNFHTDRPDAKVLHDREGTDIDKARLENTFRRLNFLVTAVDNRTDMQIVRLINDAAADDHGQFDCFVCCILTHGAHGAVYGANGMQVPVRDLTSPLRSQACPSLAGKPKLFFLQACQGNEKQQGHPDIQRDCCLETDSPPDLIPNEADFLLGYATVPGFVSFRSRTEGSWYITKLTETINRYAFSCDILDILTLVNYEVGQQTAWSAYKQSPAPMYSLRKKLVFKRPAQ